MELIPCCNNVPTLCLNMIVKNESKIITRLLDSVCKLIDCYCICDTGSTDNTIEVIETYLKIKIYQVKLCRNHLKIFVTIGMLLYNLV